MGESKRKKSEALKSVADVSPFRSDEAIAEDLRAAIDRVRDLLQEARGRHIECSFRVDPDPAGIFKAVISIEKKKSL
jgi:hypothetical protein